MSYRIGDIVEVQGVELEIVDHPHYDLAHPLDASLFGDDAICTECAIAVRPDTGDLLLLWCCGGKNWSVSREMPEHETHRTALENLNDHGANHLNQRYTRE